MDDNLHNMDFEEKDIKPAEAAISEHYHPGFYCFFQNYLQANSISFSQCFESLFNAHSKIRQMQMPLKKMLTDKQMSGLDKKKELTERSYNNFIHMHFQIQNKKPIFSFMSKSQSQKELQNLQLKLQSLKEEKVKLVSQKKQEFRERRRVQELELEKKMKQKQEIERQKK